MMKKLFAPTLLFMLLLATQASYSQSNKEQAYTKAKEAVRLEDEQGKYDEAIALFLEAQQLDPDNVSYPYELAYAYSGKKEYKKASDVLEKILSHKDVNARVYQALGNAYDNQGKSAKAIDTYKKGLEKFPASGELHLEMGNMYLIKKEYNDALSWYEKGIQAAPRFPSNYYRAALLYLNSTEEVWGMLYGEIFINLERNTGRTAEMSKLLFDTYKSQIQFTSDTSYNVSFSKTATIDASTLKDPKKFKLPFGTMVYEITLMMSIAGEKNIDIHSLDRIRTRFVENYFKGENAQKYPNILFEYQQSLLKAGHLEAYNHYLLMKGDEAGFSQWQASNKDKLTDFVKWYTDNPLQVSKDRLFYRAQY